MSASIGVESRGGEGVSLELLVDPYGWRLRGLSRVLLFDGHDELLASRQWKSPLAELVSHGEFQRDGMMPDGPLA
jgi:hypothetical protein